MSTQSGQTSSGDFDTNGRPLLSKLLIDPTWNLNETPNLLRILRDSQNNVWMFPTVLASTRGNSGGTVVTADVGLIPQGAGGASSIAASVLGINALSVNSLTLGFNGVNYDVLLDYTKNRSVSALASPQTYQNFIGNLARHLSIVCVAPASTATLDVQASVDNNNFLDCFSLAAAATNTVDLVGDSPLSSTTTIASTNVSNPVTSGGAITYVNNLNPLAFPFIKVVAGAAGAGVATTLTVSIK